MTLNDLIAPTTVLAAAALVQRVPDLRLVRVSRWLSGRWAPVVLGVVSSLVVWFMWGSIRQIGVSHDERAYLLQAELFATGRWAAPAPPLPEFFEQLHVLVTPVLASKYPPGHSLILTPGIWLGLPGLMPLALSALAGGLLFALGRRVANPWVALAAWLLWTTTSDNLRWRAGYYSEVTTSAMVLLAWWSAFHWQLSNRPALLLLLAAAVGWGAITRPLTMLAFALPLGVLVLHHIIRRRVWRDMAAAFAISVAVLAIIPVWSEATLGSWRETPLGRYTRTYLPFDRMGFGLDSTAPMRPLPADLQRVAAEFIPTHRRHTLEALPAQMTERARSVVSGTWHGWRFGLIPLAALGLVSMPLSVAFAFGSAVLLLLAYAAYAHPPAWTVYYLEVLPVLSLITALGIWRAITFVQAHSRPLGRSGRVEHAALATLLLGALSLKPVTSDLRSSRRHFSDMSFLQRQFDAEVKALPVEKAIVYVRYTPNYLGHFSLVGNVADLNAARRWIVHDRGPENEALMRLAAGRAAYLFDQKRRELFHIQPSGAPPSPQ